MDVEDRPGRPFRCRPIQPEDAEPLQQAYAPMEQLDRRAPWVAPIATLSDAAAGEILAGRRLLGDVVVRSGEFSVSWRCDPQGRGPGRRPMQALPDEADARGFETVRGSTLAENAKMPALARELGLVIRRDPDDVELVAATRTRPRAG
jgi:hypothetical protein